MKHASLFSGIGGFDLAAQWMGWKNVLHCEIADFPRQILKYYWPNAISYTDITQTDFTPHHGTIYILSGGFPCQPFSLAGKRKGTADSRHLWPEMLRAIKEITPRWVVGENVYGIVNWSKGMVFNEVQTELESAGYEVWPLLLPACGVNAPHKRDRFWFVAYRNGSRLQTEGAKQQTAGATGGSIQGFVTYANGSGMYQADRPGEPKQLNQDGKARFTGHTSGARCEKQQFTTEPTNERYTAGQFITDWGNWPTQSPVRGRNDGLPAELDGITFSKWRNQSIKGYGNAIVPQVALQIFKTIQDFETQLTHTP